MRYKDTKDPSRLRAVDRESWPELDRVDFVTRVRGSCWAVFGPYWFGRAFEDPPVFTYGLVPRLVAEEDLANNNLDDPFTTFAFTCGIERWLLDPKGVYLGANVWFAVIDFEQGDAGIFGGLVDMDLTLSWEGLSYKGYFHVFNNLHAKSGPESVVLACPEEVVG